MSAAIQELESFTQFAQQKLSEAGSTLSLEDCVRLWRQQSERTAAIDDIRQGVLDLESGLSQPLASAFDDVRRQLGLKQ